MKYLLTISLLGLLLAAGCGHKKDRTENAASLDDLNRAVTVVSMREKTFPPSTDELAKFLALSGKSMPVPPPGKKLTFDSATELFILVDQ
jgi:hypothetical protein